MAVGRVNFFGVRHIKHILQRLQRYYSDSLCSLLICNNVRKTDSSRPYPENLYAKMIPKSSSKMSPTSKPPTKTASEDGLKKSSPIIDSKMIAITHGLNSSDKIYEDTNTDDIEAHLTSKTNCYERTLPITVKGAIVRDGANRAYIDIDGYAGKMTETEFDELCDQIRSTLQFGILEENAMMESSQYGYKNVSAEGVAYENKLSYRIHYTKIHGSRKAIEQFALNVVGPQIKKLLAEFIDVFVGEDTEQQKYLNIDKKVYATNRKMRMWNSSKDYKDKDKKIVSENRPLRLIGDANIIDTLITYIPKDSVALPEPVVIESEPTNLIVSTIPSENASTETEPKTETPDNKADVAVITQILTGLLRKRVNDYDDWLKVGLICYNEGVPMSVWDDWSATSPKYAKGECAKKWITFTKGKLTQASLWKWLKEDNIALFRELCPRRTDFWSLIGNANHAETARFFYNLKPDSYAYHEGLGWYQLLPTGAWKHYQKAPSGLMLDIWNTLKAVCKEHWNLLDPSKEDDAPKVKACNAFAKSIGNKGFVEGVIAFLPANYNDDNLAKKMDESRDLFAFQDRVVELNTGTVREIRPSDYVCLHTGYDYPSERNAKARAEVIKFVEDIWEEKEVSDYMLKTIALHLCGVKKLEEFHVWTGRGGNGKGMLSDLIKRAFGDYYVPVTNGLLTQKADKKDCVNPEIAMAKGKRFLMSEEPDSGGKFKVSAIKEYTGGGTLIARVLYSNPISYVPQFGVFTQCNNMPQLDKVDGGIKRRMVVIKFPIQFVEKPTEPHHRQRKTELKDFISKSDEWRAEFVRLLLEIYPTINTNTLTKPMAVINETDEYMASNDSVRAWLNENFVTNLDINDKKYKMSAEDLRLQFIADTKTAAAEMKATIFKGLMEMNGVSQKRESHAFRSSEWVDDGTPEGRWEECDKRAGSYYLGIRPKTPAERVVV